MNLLDQQPQAGKEQNDNQTVPLCDIGSGGGAGLQGKVELVSQGAGGSVIDAHGKALTPPKGWEFLPAGDAGLTRKVTAKTGVWRVQARMGRRMISKGIWAPSVIIVEARQEVEAERATATYQKNGLVTGSGGNENRLSTKVNFFGQCGTILPLPRSTWSWNSAIAEAVTIHAVPVGSGTVARTAMIPIEERAAKAVIAWMRHRTTAYDSMTIARIKGERRQVRRMLAQRSVELLRAYREGGEIGPDCPLQHALGQAPPAQGPSFQTDPPR